MCSNSHRVVRAVCYALDAKQGQNDKEQIQRVPFDIECLSSWGEYLMELKWLEDILALHECRNFSRAAEKRNVSQPAFSRRIRLFEHWLGEEVVDRTKQPIQLTDELDRLIPQINKLVIDFYNFRSSIKMDSAARSVTFATQHTLVAGIFPRILSIIEAQVHPITVRLRTANFQECIGLMEKGEVAFVLCYESMSYPQTERLAFERLPVGDDCLIPVTAVAQDGSKLHDPERQTTIKLMNYTDGTFLKHVVNQGQMSNIMQDYSVEIICVSSLAVALKHLVLAGMGVAWLPNSLVTRELNDGSLASLETSLGRIDLPISLLRIPERSSRLASSVWESISRSDITLD